MTSRTIIVGALETNCYLIACEATRHCAVVDPGSEPEKIFLAIAEEELKPVVLVNTHGHLDHIGANRDIKDKFGVPLCIHGADREMIGRTQPLELALMLQAKDSPAPDRLLGDGDEIKVGECVLRVLHTPGHSPGSVCLQTDEILFSGDTLFFEGVGRTDLPGGSRKQLEHSIREKILRLADRTVVYPGHGPRTTIGWEKANNPDLE